jgi:hypothetical protein
MTVNRSSKQGTDRVISQLIDCFRQRLDQRCKHDGLEAARIDPDGTAY